MNKKKLYGRLILFNHDDNFRLTNSDLYLNSGQYERIDNRKNWNYKSC
jgi:hypothetical protein